MFDHVRPLNESFGTEITAPRPLSSVYLDVVLEVIDGIKQLATSLIATLKNGELLVLVLVLNLEDFKVAVGHIFHRLATAHVLRHTDLVGVLIIHNFDQLNLSLFGFLVKFEGTHMFFVETFVCIFLLKNGLGDVGQRWDGLLDWCIISKGPNAHRFGAQLFIMTH